MNENNSISNKLIINKKDKLNYIDIIIFLFSFFALSTALIAFFPGIVTSDTVVQWSQMDNNVYNSWHPIFHTLLQKLFRTIWNSPAIICIVQITCLALLLTAFCKITRDNEKKFGVICIQILVCCIICFFPINLMYSVSLWKDILYGSQKELFWYADPYIRTCLDFNQGGAMIDLRPYVARIPQKIGIGTENVYDASYPYLIQINYRAGFFTHYAGAGTIKSCKVKYKGEETDLCLCRTMAKYEKVEGGVKLITNPVTVTLADTDIEIQSIFTFVEGTGEVIAERNILTDLKGEEVTLTEYITAGYGTTEYQADLTHVLLGVDSENMLYGFKGRKITKTNAKEAYIIVPEIQTRIVMSGDVSEYEVEEGIAFSPVFRITLRKTLKNGGMKTCLSLQKAN